MFNGNPNLRKAGEHVDFDQEMVNEVIKCSVDIIHFAEKYFYIVHPDRGKELINLYDWQKKVLKAYVETPEGKKHVIVKIPRQQGKCFCNDTIVKIRNKKTGEIKEISISELYDKIKKS